MTPTGWIVAAAAFAVAAVVFFLLGIRYRKRVAEKEISSAEEEATRIINEAIKSSENKKREALLEAKEEASIPVQATNVLCKSQTSLIGSPTFNVLCLRNRSLMVM